MIKKLILLAIVLISMQEAVAQQGKLVDTVTISEQFDYLISKSNRYQEYKVVKINWLTTLKTNTLDSLNQKSKIIVEKENTINNLNEAADKLNDTIKNLEDSLKEGAIEKSSINFIGINFSKSNFKTIMLSIIGMLVLLLIFYVTKYNSGHKITEKYKDDLKALEDEFDQHRKRALEREQKIMRRLQDELNKQKENQ